MAMKHHHVIWNQTIREEFLCNVKNIVITELDPPLKSRTLCAAYPPHVGDGVQQRHPKIRTKREHVMLAVHRPRLV